ncbi:MAG: hypothetical protein AAB434_07010 [Planctomycetota bacterium]
MRYAIGVCGRLGMALGAVCMLVMSGLCAAEGDAEEAEAYVSPMFDGWKETGAIRVEREATTECPVTLWTHRAAPYDVSGVLEGKDVEKFYDDVLEVLSWSANYVEQALGGPVQEYDFVLAKGFPRDGVSAAIRGTTAMHGNVEKWHERMYSRESRKAVLYDSASHEMYHVQTYRTDPDEEKFTREFTAMFFEAAVTLKRGGIEYVWGGMASAKKDILERKLPLDRDYTKAYDATFTRGLADWAANMVHEDNKLEGVERASRALLVSKTNGVESFDEVMKECGFTLKGEAITFDRALLEFKAYIERKEKK